MTMKHHRLIGRWRIVEADLWDRAHLDLCGPASLVIRPDGSGEIAFGALQGSLGIDYGPDEIGFAWAGFDDMTEVSGAGSAELHRDGSLKIEFEYHLGEQAIPQSRPCPFFNNLLEHDPEKWIPVFRKDHAQTRRWSVMAIQRRVTTLWRSSPRSSLDPARLVTAACGV